MLLLPDGTWEMRGRAFSSADYGKQNRGIFASKTIRAGAVVGDYLGLLIPSDREDAYETGPDVYVMYYSEELSIWPDPSQPGVHIINHSCEPTCGMTSYRGHTLYFALRTIHPGEELTVAYLLAPIDEECAPCRHGCWCRARSCTGSMHLPIDRYAAWRQFDERTSGRGRPEPGEPFQQLRPLDRYPARIADRGFHGVFGSVEQPPRVLEDDRLPSRAALRREIRRTGLRLALPRLGLTVLGTDGSTIVIESA
jgi:hypothetical protein